MELINFLENSFQNVRSSKRTDILHKLVKKEILAKNPKWENLDWVYEYKLPVDGYGGTFDIDIAGFRNGDLKAAILVKAVNSNVSKNMKNYANCSIGEAHRLMDAPDLCLEKVLFVSFLPRIAPRFKEGGVVSGFDNVLSSKERTKISPIFEKYWGDKVLSVDLYYDISDVENKKSKSEFTNIIVENFNGINTVSW